MTILGMVHAGEIELAISYAIPNETLCVLWDKFLSALRAASGVTCRCDNARDFSVHRPARALRAPEKPWLVASRGERLLIVLSGLPGVGKTTIAR